MGEVHPPPEAAGGEHPEPGGTRRPVSLKVGDTVQVLVGPHS